MKILRADDYATVPWKNGGGMTREIAVHRDASLHSDFLWRLSIATVAQSGPFSLFEGVDRTIVLMSGGGMQLNLPTEAISVTGDAPPFSFDGETKISCALLRGPSVDLNAMTRRGFFQHTLVRKRFTGWKTVEATADQTFVVANALLTLSGPHRESFRPLDTVAAISPGTTVELYSDRDAEFFIVEIMRQRV